MAENKKISFLEVDNKKSTIKELLEEELLQIMADRGFARALTLKDYYISIILYLLKDVKGICFKGGTALQKTLLDYSRLSEDIDFTLTRDLNKVKEEIIRILNDSKLFGKIDKDKDVTKFTRLIAPYSSSLGRGEIFLDLNERGKLLLKPELLDMKHFYPNIPKYNFLCLNRKEMIAEKVAAAIGRNKPRDHYDIYQIIKHKIPVDMSLVEKKCKQSGDEFDITKMFNRAKKRHKRWNADMIPLLAEDVKFQEVMKTLADHFDLKSYR
ncbi:nucleotidyl transferase AbiEii/AbiGii toxin family protein [Candidatus Woesearchaeota archaeon]|nr:nucleotidyl transferase AbiEii/AbiGii toxin family protein [Candidatus Woesearchaeota archaeon]